MQRLNQAELNKQLFILFSLCRPPPTHILMSRYKRYVGFVSVSSLKLDDQLKMGSCSSGRMSFFFCAETPVWRWLYELKKPTRLSRKPMLLRTNVRYINYDRGFSIVFAMKRPLKVSILLPWKPLSSIHVQQQLCDAALIHVWKTLCKLKSNIYKKGFLLCIH